MRLFINLTPFIPLSILGEGEYFLKRGASAPLKHPAFGGRGKIRDKPQTPIGREGGKNRGLRAKPNGREGGKKNVSQKRGGVDRSLNTLGRRRVSGEL